MFVEQIETLHAKLSATSKYRSLYVHSSSAEVAGLQLMDTCSRSCVVPKKKKERKKTLAPDYGTRHLILCAIPSGDQHSNRTASDIVLFTLTLL